MIYRPPQSDAWTIMGRGPSLLRCTQADALDGPVVAVNGAVYHHAIHTDYLVGLDYPEQWLDPVPGVPWGDAAPAPEVVTSNAKKWIPFVQRTGVTLRPFPGGHGGNGEVAGLIGDKRRIVVYTRWSILLALGWARFGGAKRIRLLGVDMEGDQRAYGGGNRIHFERWATKEGPDFEKALLACEAAGVEVERYTA